jgi:hypothetical protein
MIQYANNVLMNKQSDNLAEGDLTEGNMPMKK